MRRHCGQREIVVTDDAGRAPGQRPFGRRRSEIGLSSPADRSKRSAGSSGLGRAGWTRRMAGTGRGAGGRRSGLSIGIADGQETVRPKLWWLLGIPTGAAGGRPRRRRACRDGNPRPAAARCPSPRFGCRAVTVWGDPGTRWSRRRRPSSGGWDHHGRPRRVRPRRPAQRCLWVTHGPGPRCPSTVLGPRWQGTC
jgi:hypothetical protein